MRRSVSETDVDWTPLKRGGTNFRTHKLVEIDPDVVAFRPSTGALVFYWVFIIAGLIPISIALWQIADTWSPLRPEILIPLGIGLVFGIIGLALFIFGTRPIVFDRNREYFWKGRKDPDAVWDRRELKHFKKLDDVMALQLLTEVVSSDKGSFRSYELNLVLRDGSRVNVIDHGNLERIQDDSERLAAFLDLEIATRA